jgi:hypothetical protein
MKKLLTALIFAFATTSALAQVGALQAPNNLSDLVSAAMARTNLGLGGAAVLNVGTGEASVAAGNDVRFVAITNGTLTVTGTLNIGSNLTLTGSDSSYTLSANAGGYTLPVAQTSTLGGVMANAGSAGQFVNGINTSTGALTYDTPPGAYSCPAASTSTAGCTEYGTTSGTAAQGNDSRFTSVANPTATAGASAVNGSTGHWMDAGSAPAVVKAASSTFGIVEPDNQTMVCTAGVCGTTAPDRTATSSGSILAGDMGGQVNFNGSGLTVTIPAISGSVLASGMTVRIVNQNSSPLTVSSAPTINNCSGTIPQGQGWDLTSNGTSLDCTALGVSGSSSGAVTQIVTASASGSSLVLYPLTTGSFGEITIQCRGLYTSDGSTISLLLMNGTGPTAITSGYNVTGLYLNLVPSVQPFSSTGQTSLWTMEVGNSATKAGGMQWTWDNLPISGVVHTGMGRMNAVTNGSGFRYFVEMSASYTGDTNPITGFEITSSATLSGTCTALGSN